MVKVFLQPGAKIDLAVAQTTAVSQAMLRQAPVGTVTVGKPCADRGGERFGLQACQGPADRRLTGRGPVSGQRITPCTQRGQDGLWHVRGPFSDRGHRLGTSQDCGSGDGKDRDKRVTPPRPGPRIIDRGKIGEQVRWFAWSEPIGVSKLGQAPWDRGCWVGRHGLHHHHEAVRTA